VWNNRDLHIKLLSLAQGECFGALIEADLWVVCHRCPKGQAWGSQFAYNLMWNHDALPGMLGVAVVVPGPGRCTAPPLAAAAAAAVPLLLLLWCD
jgi:hypothetical protein